MKKYKEDIIDYLIPISIGITIEILLVLPQLINRIGFTGDDTIFHFSRFLDTAEQIKNHNFSYFQMIYGMGQTGRIINALYGPLFAYLMGVLVLISGSWFRFQILLTILLFIIGSVGFFKLSRKINISRTVASIVTSLFLVTGYTFYWIYSNNGNCLGAFLMPYVLMQGIDLINSDKKEINWITLGITISILAQIHLLSTFMAVLVLVPCFIYGLIHSTDKKRLWINVGKSIVLFIILTANVWGAFIYLYTTNTLSAPLDFPAVNSTLNLFAFGKTTMWKSITGVTTVLLCLQLIYVGFNFKSSKLNTFLTLEGLVFLLLSSNLFPWSFIDKELPAVSSYFQFPNRFTVLAYPLLYLGIGLTLTEINKKWGLKVGIVVNVLVLLVAICNYNSDLTEVNNKVLYERTNSQRIEKFKDKNLLHYFTQQPNNPDYLPIQRKISSWDIEKLVDKELIYDQSVNKTAISNGRLQLKWNEEETSIKTLPIVMYHQSELSINGKKVKPKLNVIGMPQIKAKKGENVAILSFKTPIAFKGLLCVTIIGWLGILIYSMVSLFKYCSRK